VQSGSQDNSRGPLNGYLERSSYHGLFIDARDNLQNFQRGHFQLGQHQEPVKNHGAGGNMERLAEAAPTFPIATLRTGLLALFTSPPCITGPLKPRPPPRGVALAAAAAALSRYSRPVVGKRRRASVVPGAVGVGGDERPRTEVRIAGVDLDFLRV
jgi:hypothetical protein